MRYVHIFEEYTPENSVKFLEMFLKRFPFETELEELGIEHRLIKPRMPEHNGKVERSLRMDQRYFYDWETFRETDEANEKLEEHMKWTINKPMRIFKGKSPMQKLEDYIWLI